MVMDGEFTKNIKKKTIIQDFKVLDNLGNVIGYVVNSKDESEAQKMAIKQENYFSIQECNSLNVPNMFQNCLMDEISVNQFKKI